MQFRVIVVTDQQTNTPTDKTNYNTLRLASMQCNNTKKARARTSAIIIKVFD